MSQPVSVSAQSAVQVQASSILQSLAVLAFGLVMLFAVGFAPMEVAHNAAHDTRHSAAFPCH